MSTSSNATTTVRISEETREMAEALRAECGFRSLTSVFDAMIAFFDEVSRDSFVEHVRSQGTAVRPRQRRTKPAADDLAVGVAQ